MARDFIKKRYTELRSTTGKLTRKSHEHLNQFQESRATSQMSNPFGESYDNNHFVSITTINKSANKQDMFDQSPIYTYTS